MVTHALGKWQGAAVKPTVSTTAFHRLGYACAGPHAHVSLSFATDCKQNQILKPSAAEAMHDCYTWL